MKKWQWIWLFAHALGVAGIVVAISLVIIRPEDIYPYQTAVGLLVSSIVLWVWGWRVWFKNV